MISCDFDPLLSSIRKDSIESQYATGRFHPGGARNAAEAGVFSVSARRATANPPTTASARQRLYAAGRFTDNGANDYCCDLRSSAHGAADEARPRGGDDPPRHRIRARHQEVL